MNLPSIILATAQPPSRGQHRLIVKVQISFSHPRTSKTLFVCSPNGINISADRRHLNFNLNLFTSVFVVDFVDLTASLFLLTFFSRCLYHFRDNLITSSQPVPKPHFATAAKYSNDHSTVSVAIFLMNLIHSAAAHESWLGIAIENAMNGESARCLLRGLQDCLWLSRLLKHQQELQRFTIICHNFLY